MNVFRHPRALPSSFQTSRLAPGRFRIRHSALLTVEIRGLEPLTYGLQSRRSSQLSYIPSLAGACFRLRPICCAVPSGSAVHSKKGMGRKAVGDRSGFAEQPEGRSTCAFRPEGPQRLFAQKPGGPCDCRRSSAKRNSIGVSEGNSTLSL